MNKKVGLCLAFRGENYGALLQAYATQHVIDAYGFDTEILDYYSGRKKGLRFTPWLVVVVAKQLFARLKKKRPEPLDEIHWHNIMQRKDEAESFRNRRLHDVVRIDGIDELRKAGGNYFAVLVGSDQQWLPDISFTNFKTLRFVPVSVTKISYATSLGVSNYPRYCESSARQFWSRIDFLSVREEEGRNEIKRICGDIDVARVVDPTYLLTRGEWEKIIPVECVVREKYVLCYLLGPEKEPRIAARKYAEARQLKLVSILSDESVGDGDLDFADITLSGMSPEEFVNLIRGAERVFTDSFHGIAFSVINEVQFSVFYRQRKDAEGSRNSRIDNILRMWGLEDCLKLTADADNEEIDYGVVSAKVDEQRASSRRFLEVALGVRDE